MSLNSLRHHSSLPFKYKPLSKFVKLFFERKEIFRNVYNKFWQINVGACPAIGLPDFCTVSGGTSPINWATTNMDHNILWFLLPCWCSSLPKIAKQLGRNICKSNRNLPKNSNIARKFFRKFEMFFETEPGLSMKTSLINYWQKRFLFCDINSYWENKRFFHFLRGDGTFFALLQYDSSYVKRGEQERTNKRSYLFEKEEFIYRLLKKVGAFSFLSFSIVRLYLVLWIHNWNFWSQGL